MSDRPLSDNKQAACKICGECEPFHVHDGDRRIEDYFTVGRGMTDMEAARAWKARALAAEAALRDPSDDCPDCHSMSFHTCNTCNGTGKVPLRDPSEEEEALRQALKEAVAILDAVRARSEVRNHATGRRELSPPVSDETRAAADSWLAQWEPLTKPALAARQGEDT